MSKRKIGLLALSLCLVAILAVGGTLAYLTSTSGAKNTFTVGKVSITLKEYQRNKDHTALEDFKNGKVLLPLVGSAQGDKETVGGVANLPKAANYVDKIMKIKNNATEAFVRIYVAIPEVLDNVTNAGQNILHFNWTPESDSDWGKETCVLQSVDIEGMKYNIYYRDYKHVLGEGDETKTPAYVGFYLDSKVDLAPDHLTIDEDLGIYTPYTINGQLIDYNFNNGVTIPVMAVGVQAAGFENTAEAINAAFGANFNPWAN